ncbi:MAG: 50S ribosomal protein L13 [Ktedonobacterales bacterium]
MNPKTYSAKLDELDPQWYIIDADDQILGRLATEIATILRGKHKPTFTPHLLSGDFVVVINASKIAVTRNRLDQKMYYRHSQYPGGLKQETLRDALRKHPERVIEWAVQGMLPQNRLADRIMTRLKVYPGAEHPHHAQQPIPWARPKAEAVLAAQRQANEQQSQA